MGLSIFFPCYNEEENVALLTGKIHEALEGYTADLGTQRTLAGTESFWARAQVVNGARAAGVQPIDTVFSDVTELARARAELEQHRDHLQELVKRRSAELAASEARYRNLVERANDGIIIVAQSAAQGWTAPGGDLA